MARRSRKAARTKKKSDFVLTSHDEEKLLLFASGLLLGVGLSLSLFFNYWWYGGMVAIALGVVLLLIGKTRG